MNSPIRPRIVQAALVWRLVDDEVAAPDAAGEGLQV